MPVVSDLFTTSTRFLSTSSCLSVLCEVDIGDEKERATGKEREGERARGGGRSREVRVRLLHSR